VQPSISIYQDESKLKSILLLTMRDTRPTMKILLLQIQLMTRQFKHHYIRYCLSCLQVRESLLMSYRI